MLSEFEEYNDKVEMYFQFYFIQFEFKHNRKKWTWM